MNGTDLRQSLISTMRHLLDYKESILLQIEKARDVILISIKESENKEMRPISLENDALWFNYLVESYNQVESDIALATKALSQLGVSLPGLSGSNNELNRNHEKNQGAESLDFSVSKER